MSVWPPATKTEGVLAQPDAFADISCWKPPLFSGRVIAAFVAGEKTLARSGEALVIEDVAKELGISDRRTPKVTTTRQLSTIPEWIRRRGSG